MASSSASTSGDYALSLQKIATEFSAFAARVAKKHGGGSEDGSDSQNDSEDDEGDHADDGSQLTKFMTRICTVLRQARNNASSAVDIAHIIGEADKLLSEMIDFAYGDHDYALFDFLPSFAHDEDSAPLIVDGDSTGLGINASAARQFDTLISFIFGNERPREIADLIPRRRYIDAPKPHGKTTPLSFFRKDVTPSATNETPLAKAIGDACCEISSTGICYPVQLSISRSSSCMALAAAGSWKNRSPVLTYYVLDGPLDQYHMPTEVAIDVGLAGVACHVATDDQRKLIFVADNDRVKSYAYAVRANAKITLPKHTLASAGSGPLAISHDNTRILRAGEGYVQVWTIDDLPDHGPSGRRRIGKKISIEDTWRDDGEDIERSAGSDATSTFKFTDRTLTPTVWGAHPSTPATHMITAFKDTHSAVAIDIQSEGQEAARYLGHGGHILSFSTSDSDSSVFLTSATDGVVRLFDVREPLPQISFDAGNQNEFIDCALLVHPQGVPFVFTGGEKSEQIRLWDVRARALVYELSTGNNGVVDMAWDAVRSTLYAATECTYMDRMGSHHGYRPAKFPRQHATSGDSMDVEEGAVDDNENEDSEEDDDDEDRYWPSNAYHSEEYFGYPFDSGDHTLLRYAFGVDIDPSILPSYGHAYPHQEQW